MHPQVVVLLAVASLIVAAPLDDNSNPYFDRIFDNQLAATEHPSYMTYSLVDRGVPYSDCKAWCQTLPGCQAVNAYLDNYGKGTTGANGKADQYTCSAFSAPISSCMNTNAGGQDQHGDGILNKITKSAGFNLKNPSKCGTPSTAWDLHHASTNASEGTHFYTVFTNQIAELGSDFVDQGVIGKVFTNQAPSTTPLFRLYNAFKKDYLFTISPLERDNAVTYFQYATEGTAAYIYATGECGGIPLYRSLNGVSHLYTTDVNERNATGYVFEGVAGYILA